MLAMVALGQVFQVCRCIGLGLHGLVIMAACLKSVKTSGLLFYLID